MLFENRIVARLQRLPGLLIANRNITPSTHVATATMIGTAMWNGLLNGSANALQVIRQVARVKVSLDRHHAATNVHSHGGRNNCTLRRNDAAHRRANAPVHIGHSGNPLENEGELRDVQELLTSLIFQLHPLRPSLDGRALLRDDYVVGCVCHSALLHCFSLSIRRGAGSLSLTLRFLWFATPISLTNLSLLPSSSSADVMQGWGRSGYSAMCQIMHHIFR